MFEFLSAGFVVDISVWGASYAISRLGVPIWLAELIWEQAFFFSQLKNKKACEGQIL